VNALHLLRALGSIGLLCALVPAVPRAQGELVLHVVEAATGEATPARVELLNEAGEGCVAPDALEVGDDVVSRAEPWEGSLEQWRAGLVSHVVDAETGTDQFYTTGTSRLPLPAGEYALRVVKGFEYRAATRTLTIRTGESLAVEVRLQRWIDMPAAGWFGADGHLHVGRRFAELDPSLARWMQAEDVHVGGMLSWGHSKRFINSWQAGYGSLSAYQEGHTLIFSGQENPRTSFLGHAIVLGADEPLDDPEHYFLYRPLWERARAQGALCGMAHHGMLLGAENELALALPHGLPDFVEVLQFREPRYGAWYRALNCGFRVTPTAGTDYPLGRSLPGRERFYTRVEGPFDYAHWLDGLRRGRVFVTTGPMLEFQVDERGMGEELRLDAPREVRVRGAVRFDPGHDDVERLELVRDGEVVAAFPRTPDAAEIRFERTLRLEEACWLALRSRGRLVRGASPATSATHSAPVYVVVAGRPSMVDLPVARPSLDEWLAILDRLEASLADGRIEELIAKEIHHTSLNPGGVPKLVPLPGDEDLERRLRGCSAALRAEIDAARAFYRRRP